MPETTFHTHIKLHFQAEDEKKKGPELNGSKLVQV
jgi:hypothetical protein